MGFIPWETDWDYPAGSWWDTFPGAESGWWPWAEEEVEQAGDSGVARLVLERALELGQPGAGCLSPRGQLLAMGYPRGGITLAGRPTRGPGVEGAEPSAASLPSSCGSEGLTCS